MATVPLGYLSAYLVGFYYHDLSVICDFPVLFRLLTL